MGIVKYNTIIDGLRGKVGGIVASDGHYGPYLRTKVIPYNPQSTDQGVVRGRITTASQAWKGLTNEKRAAWEALALQVKATNVFGVVRSLSGFNLFIKINCNRALIGQTQLTDAPAYALPTPLTAFSFSDPANDVLEFTFTPTPITAGNYVIVRASSFVSAGKSFVKSEYRFMKAIAPAATSPQNILSQYVAKFGTPTVGTRVFLEIYPILTASGLPGASLYDNKIITGT
jgi:hypothetical protein